MSTRRRASPTTRCRRRWPAGRGPPRPAATACAHVLSFEVAGADHDAALEGGQAEARDEELARDAGDHPGGKHIADEHDQRRHGEACRRRVEQAAEVGSPAGASRPTIRRPVRRHRDREQGRRPVVVFGKSQAKRTTTAGTAAARATVGWSAKVTARHTPAPGPRCRAPSGENAPSCLRSPRSWSPIAVRSPCASSGRCATSGSGPSPSTRSRTRLAVARGRRGLPARPGPPAEALSPSERILDAASAGAEAIHPGWFLAENAAFAAPSKAGLVWIGPPPEAIEAMGSKVTARRLMQEAGVPGIPDDRSGRVGRRGGRARGRARLARGDQGLRRRGGKGLKVVRSADEAERALASARREGEAYFQTAVYVERFLEDPRHVEVQVLADAHGAVVHLGERDCTIQRLPEARRGAVAGGHAGAPATDRRHRGRGAGRRLPRGRDDRGPPRPPANYFFLEMNTRIQVEHTVTELVTGLDLVREQVLVAAGEPLSFGQEDVRFSGHAIECRINAERPAPGLPARPRHDRRVPRARRARRASTRA